MVVDDSWVLLGSGNWDPRSLYLNFEFNVEVYDRELAVAVNAILAHKKSQGAELSPRHRDRSHQLSHLRNSVFRLFSPYL
jgi:cardiolipin synthase